MKIINLTDVEKSEIKYKISKFPDGQQNISLLNANKEIAGKFINPGTHTYSFVLPKEEIKIISRLNNWLDLELIVCTVACLRELDVKEIHLFTPYFMGARSDRKFEEGGNWYLKQVICPIHGEFEQFPRNLLLSACKTGCKKCGLESKNKSKTKSLESFLIKANNIHNNKYEYKINNYQNRKSKITVICKKHGKFVKSAQKHLSGQGCFHCRIDKLIETNILVGGYSEELFNNKPELKNKKAYLYYISINKGKSYKIGISTKIENRMRGIKCKASGFIKTMDLLWTIEDTLYNCFKKEQEILEKYKKNRVFFKWSTEIFNKNILPIKLNNLN